MKKKIIFTFLIGLVFLPVCYATEEPNLLPDGGSNEAGMHIELFNVDGNGEWQPVNLGSVSEYVHVVFKNIPVDVNKVFVYLDEAQIGNWIRDGYFSHESFGFESNEFSNGRHKIKLVSINSAGEITNHPPIDAYFNNLLYNVSGDDQFHPTEDYHRRGFYDGGKTLEVKLTGLHGEVIWSNRYSGNYIDINIPGSAFGTEQLCNIDINEVQDSSKETTLVVSSGNGKQTRTSIEFFQADKYFAPPADETVAALLYPPYGEINGYQPSILFGDKKLAEKLMGKSLEPEKIIGGREWLVKIIKAYKAALKEAGEKKFYRDTHEPMGQIVFVTKKKGYIRTIDIDAYNVFDDYMESGTLKTYFYELGLTEKPLPGKPPKEFEFIWNSKYFVPSADETTAILLYNSGGEPAILIGDKERAEQNMGKYIVPGKIIEDQNLLKEITAAYRKALKEAEDSNFASGGDGSWRILFVTPTGGYHRTIGMDEETIYDNHMESSLLKTLFDESGLTDELLGEGPNFRHTQARKYRLPPKDKTVAILLYHNSDRQPLALFGDKKQTEQLIKGELDGKPLEPNKVFDGREWLEKIMDECGAALKRAEETKFNKAGSTKGLIVFVTMERGHMRRIGVDANTAYSSDMESELLKQYFDELGLTKELLAEEPNKTSPD